MNYKVIIMYESIIKTDKEGSWFFHPGKHMLLNGSRKNLGQKPSPLSLKEVIKIIEEVKSRPRLIRSGLIRNGEVSELLPDDSVRR